MFLIRAINFNSISSLQDRAFGSVFIALLLFPIFSLYKDRNALINIPYISTHHISINAQFEPEIHLLPQPHSKIEVIQPEVETIQPEIEAVQVIPINGGTYRIMTDWCKREEASVFPICASSSASHTKHLRLAYSQYATTPQYLCNSLIIFTSLRAVKTEAELALIYPEEWDLQPLPEAGSTTHNSIPKLLQKARALGVNLHPSKLLKKSIGDPTWAESFMKLKVLELVDYARIIHMDSDGLVMKNMDHLFFSPLAEIAIPKAYWLNKLEEKSPVLSSQFMMVMPSQLLYAKMLKIFETDTTGGFDMEIMNTLANAGDALILPHKTYDMVSGEYRKDDHSQYLEGSTTSQWDADTEAAASHYVHFSDWPLQKPWFDDPNTLAQIAPQCSSPQDPCRNRYHWIKLYQDFKTLDREVCEL